MVDYKSLSDQYLVNYLKQGHTLAFAELYNRYKVPLYLHAYRMLQDEEESKDVVQELFAGLWLRRDQLMISKTFDAYLYGAVRNKILNYISHQKVVGKYIDSLNLHIEKSAPTGDELLIEKELSELFAREIAQLPKKMREIFELSRNGGLSHKQIAHELMISDKTVKKQINNALKILSIRINVRLFLYFFF